MSGFQPERKTVGPDPFVIVFIGINGGNEFYEYDPGLQVHERWETKARLPYYKQDGCCHCTVVVVTVAAVGVVAVVVIVVVVVVVVVVVADVVAVVVAAAADGGRRRRVAW